MTRATKRGYVVITAFWIGITLSLLLCPCRLPFTIIETQKELAIITKNYQLRMSKSPVHFRTFRQGKVILRSTRSDNDMAEFAPGAFLDTEEGSWSHITSFEGWSRPGPDRVVLHFLTNGRPELLRYEIIPHEKYYTIIIDTDGVSVTEIGDTYELDASGHWYGQGEIGHPFASIPKFNKPAQYHPWRTENSFTPETLEITREFAWIHQDLVDEIWDLVIEAQQTGMPIVRPLFFEYPEDQNTYPIDDQFFLGPDILVAPVVYDGVRSRDVYLPAGTWRNFWSDEELSGPALLEKYPAPIERIPVFIRKKG